jgi:hypothetical protein
MRFRTPSLPLAGALLLTAAVALPLDAQTDLTVIGVNHDEREGEKPFTMYLRDGEMRMDQGNQTMILRFTGENPGMLLIDHDKERVDFLPSEMVNRGEGAVSARTVEAYETDSEPMPGMEKLAPVPETVTVIRGGNPEEVPVRGTPVGYHYEGDASLPGLEGAAMPANMRDMLKVVLQMDSRAVVDPSIPGAEAAVAFYERAVESGLASNSPTFASMTAGLMEVNQKIAENGFPVWVGTRSEVDIQVSGPMAGMMEGMVQGMPGVGPNISVSVIESVSTDPVDGALFYDGGTPEGYDVNVLDLSGASR